MKIPPRVYPIMSLVDKPAEEEPLDFAWDPPPRYTALGGGGGEEDDLSGGDGD